MYGNNLVVMVTIVHVMVTRVKPDDLAFIYTKRQRQRFDNAAMTLAILVSLKIMQSLQNRLQPQSEAILLFSVRTGSFR